MESEKACDSCVEFKNTLKTLISSVEELVQKDSAFEHSDMLESIRQQALKLLRLSGIEVNLENDGRAGEINQIRELICPPALCANGTPTIRKNLPVLLIVDDDVHFRTYLRQIFEKEYNVLEASTGGEGLNIVFQKTPVIVIASLTMPFMNGAELSREMKLNPSTRSVPVLLIIKSELWNEKSAENSIETNGYRTNFNAERLISQVNFLTAQRRVIQKNMNLEIGGGESACHILSANDKTIDKVLFIIENNLSKPDFSVAKLSAAMGMSRISLYNKIKKKTGLTPVELIRTIRIGKAAEILLQKGVSIAEAAYMVGFNDARYFSRYFKSQFNILPSRFAKKKKYPS